MEGTEQKQTKPSLEQQVAAWSAERSEIAALAATAEGISIAGHADGPKAGREVVHNTLMPIWRRRCAIQSREKELLEIPKQITEQIKRTAADLAAPLLAAEDRLRKDRDAYDAEQERIKAEAKEAERLRVQARVEAMVSAGVAPDIQKATHLTDEQFVALIEEGKAEQIKRNRAVEVAQELTSLGDDCTDAEAYDLTTDQAEHRLTVARKAFADREEAARIKREEEAAAQKKIDDAAEEKRLAEQAEADRKRNEEIEKERAARVKLELGSRRSMELATLGLFVTLQECSEWTEEAFTAAMKDATDAKTLRDGEEQKLREQIAQEERARLEAQRTQQARFDRAVERCRILALLGEYEQPDNIADISEDTFQEKVGVATIAKQKRDAETARQLLAEQERQEAERQAKERADEQERQEAASRERELQEAIRPQREAVAKWAQAALDAMPSTPDIDDPDILRAMRDHVERARLALLDLRDRMTQEPADG